MSSTFPVSVPGRPDLAGASRAVPAVLGWLIRSQWRRITVGVVLTALWLGVQPLMPLFVGLALDEGIVAGDARRLLMWSGALALVIAFQAVGGVSSYHFFHRSMLDSQFRAAQVVAARVAELGARLRARTASGEVMSVGSADALALGRFSGVLCHIGGALAAFAVVLAILMAQSPLLGAVMLAALPLMGLALWPVFTAIAHRRGRQRADIGTLNTLGTDTVTGLRVLRGIGGEDAFVRRYTAASQDVRRSGTILVRALALLHAARVLLPGLLLLVLLWLGARLAIAGTISPGELVAFYGYVVFLLRPLQLTIQGIDALAGAKVAARRLATLLEERPVTGEPAESADPRPWPGPADLCDDATGVRIRPGRFTVIASDAPERLAGLPERLARYTDPPARLGETSLAAYPLGEVRRRIHLLPQDAQLFSGDLRTQLDVDGERGDADIVRALHTASALEIVGMDPALVEHDPPPDLRYDLHQEVAERGRGYSGGERQRLMLARALLTEAEILVLDEPTSAVDAQTEQRIARRLAEHRRGRTTVVFGSSPLLLAWADDVVFLADTPRCGTHRELLHDPDYRMVVAR